MTTRSRRQPQLVAFVVAIALAACSGAPGTTPASSPVAQAKHPNVQDQHLYITFHNRVDGYTWLTRYWSYSALPTWHVEGANCIAPGETFKTDIVWKNGGPQAKLRVEIRGEKNCAGPNLHGGNLLGPKCMLNVDGSRGVFDAYADVRLTGSVGQFDLSDFTKTEGHARPCRD